MIPPAVKYSSEHSLLIEGRGSSVDGLWFNIPFWFQKIDDGVYREWLFEKLPKEIQDMVSPLETKTPFDESYNTGVDACIAKVKSLDTWEPSEDYIFSKIISELEQLKKPIQ